MKKYFIHENHVTFLRECAEKIGRLSEIMSAEADKLTDAQKAEAAAICEYMWTDGRAGYFCELLRGIKNELKPVTLADIYKPQPPCYEEKPRYIPPTYAEMMRDGTDRDGAALKRGRA